MKRKMKPVKTVRAWGGFAPSASGWASAIEAAAKVCRHMADANRDAIERLAEKDRDIEPAWYAVQVATKLELAIRALPPAAAMEDSALVERVAEAICNSRDDNWFSHPLLGHGPGECSTCDAEREGWLNAARAALAVIQGQGE